MSPNTRSTPTFPVPASARVHPITTPTAATPAATAPVKATVPTITTPSSAAAPTSTAIAVHPATQTAKHSESLSTAAIAAVIVAAVLVFACIAWALARRRAFEPHWLLSLRHAMAEAGFRASATWAEFTDWARLGH
jgi:hypothetical protein